MAVIFDHDVGMLGLDALRKLAKERGLTDSGHVFQANLLCTGCYLLVGELLIIVESVHW